MRGCRWLAIALCLIHLALPSSSEAQKAPDPALAATQQALELIAERHADPVDEAKLVVAALNELDGISQLSEPLLGARGLGKLPANAAERRRRLIGVLEAAFKRIREGHDLSDEALADAAIKGMVAALDPGSLYIDAAKWRDNQGWAKRGSIGLKLTEDRGIRVVEPIEDAPAQLAGIQAGDFILAIDKEPVAGWPLASVVSKLNGPLDSEITLTIGRPGAAAPLDVTMRRATVRLPHVHARLIDGVGYVALTGFYPHTAAKLKAALAKLRAEAGAGFKGYILDLRDNPGGLLDGATAAAGIFFETALVATTKARGKDIDRLQAGSLDPLREGKLVVLINRGTAAAAELLANVLKEHRDAVLVGSITAGAGSVQTVLGLGEGNGALRLTTSRLFLPNGKPLDKNGIKPDQAVEDSRDRDKDQPATPALEPRLDAKDRQLQAALKVLGK